VLWLHTVTCEACVHTPHMRGTGYYLPQNLRILSMRKLLKP